MPRKMTPTDAEWRARLTPLQYNVTRKRGTERSFSGEYLTNTRPGIYCCIGCGSPLFDAQAKFDAASGWPSFRSALRPDCIRTEEDHAWFRERTAAACSACGSHLGHVQYDDENAPAPGGPYYCINSAALLFKPAKS